MKDEKYMIISKVLQICLLFSNNYVLFVILHMMTCPASLRLFPRLRLFKCCNMSPTHDVFRSMLVTNLTALR